MGGCGANLSESEQNAARASFERFVLVSSVVIPTVLGVVFIVGLVGNATLIYTILANKSMRTKSNVLIVSLAAGDFLLILVTGPFTTLLYTTGGWWYGTAMCKVSRFIQPVLVDQSSFNNGMTERKPTIHKILYIG